MMHNPFCSVIRFIQLIMQNKLEMNQNYLNQSIVVDRQKYLIFRAVKVNEKYSSSSPVILVLRFQFAHSSLKRDAIVSFFQIPIFVGLSGFQGKLWTYDQQNNTFQGIYQWETLVDANDYLNSFAVKYVKKKAVKNSLTSMLIENADLEHYVKRGLCG